MTEGTILVIGATGFIGRAVARKLTALGFRVVGTGRDAATPGCDLALDIGDPGCVDKCAVLGEIDTVICCAGLAHQFGPVETSEFTRVNRDGAANAMRIAVQAKAGRFILVSSVAVYGDHGAELVDEESECRPVGDYATSKYLGEAAVRELIADGGPEVVVIRPSTVVGRGDRGNTARLASAIARGRFVWIGHGENRKSLVACDDVAEAIARAATAKGKVAGTYNVSAPPIAMRDVVGALAEATGRPVSRFAIPRRPIELVTALNRRTLAFGPIERVGATVEKFLSDDLFSAGKFDEAFGPLEYRSIPDTLRDAVLAGGTAIE